MNATALQAFAAKRIRAIAIVGRRGVAHSAFTIAEFRELARFQPERVKVSVEAFDLAAALQAPGIANPRAHKRLMELVHSFSISPAQHDAERRAIETDPEGRPFPTAASPETSLTLPATAAAESCAVRFHYHLKPVRILATPDGHVRGVLFERTEPDDRADSPAKSRYCVLPCDLVVGSVGYLADPLPGMPLDAKSGAIAHQNGRVVGHPRVYVSGWAKNGAKGVILHAIPDAAEVAAAIHHDLAAKRLPTEASHDDNADSNNPNTTTMLGKYGLIDDFVERGLEPVSIAGVERILHVEQERGVDLGKAAEKIDTVRDMLDLALGGEVGRRTNDRVRGIAPARPEPLMYLRELLDNKTDLAPLAKTLAKEVPGRMAERPHPGHPSPAQ
ncbi:unnamed protein product [Phytomonas sp. Hart1]|nr:unnamed protein product [Phytomonas sp. Hart1]|eukprot:CCW71815.1 unnamed protein product [Phytomonas sp. isolate Hart1]